MCECFASMYVHTMYMPGAHGGSKSALDPLLTGIVAVLKVSGHVGARSRTWALHKRKDP